MHFPSFPSFQYLCYGEVYFSNKFRDIEFFLPVSLVSFLSFNSSSSTFIILTLTSTLTCFTVHGNLLGSWFHSGIDRRCSTLSATPTSLRRRCGYSSRVLRGPGSHSKQGVNTDVVRWWWMKEEIRKQATCQVSFSLHKPFLMGNPKLKIQETLSSTCTKIFTCKDTLCTKKLSTICMYLM